MTGNYITGFVAALVMESSHWTRLRWDFDEKATARAWQLTTIVIAIAAVFTWLEGSPVTALPRLIALLPPLLLPMAFIQNYGLRDTIPLTALSFFAKQRRARNKLLGVESRVIHFHFGNVVFLVTLVSATLGDTSAMRYAFLPGLLILILWKLLSLTRRNWWPLFFAISLAGGLALLGEYGLGRAYDLMTTGGSRDRGGSSFDAEFKKTSIGSLGPLKMSPNIVWRLEFKDLKKIPKLLRTASYETYNGIAWKNPHLRPEATVDTDFKDLILAGAADDYYVLKEQDQVDPRDTRADLPRFTLRGAATNNTPLPLPGDAASLTGFEVDAIERNTMGTVRIAPKRAVIEGTVLWGADVPPDSPPSEEALKVAPAEQKVIHQVAAELQLPAQSTTKEKIALLRSWFQRDFEYTRYLSIPRYRNAQKMNTEIGNFLTKTRKGHCEYFATAACLLLRDAGVPTRYVIGYAVMEKDPKRPEYLLRGTHAHAWCRVWDVEAKRWIDFDPTPPSWLTIEDVRTSSTQWLTDGFQRFREDFFLWRNEPANRLGVTVVMSVIACSVLGFIGWKLWGSRRRLAEEKRYKPGKPLRRTPLHELEAEVQKKIGTRPVGVPFPEWLRQVPLQDSDGMEEAIRLHQQLRFDPEAADETTFDRLEELVKRLQKAIRG